MSRLESALAALRVEELALDVEDLDPLEGLFQLFDFMNGHFEREGHLVLSHFTTWCKQAFRHLVQQVLCSQQKQCGQRYLFG
jgi:hypothetical protein